MAKTEVRMAPAEEETLRMVNAKCAGDYEDMFRLNFAEIASDFSVICDRYNIQTRSEMSAILRTVAPIIFEGARDYLKDCINDFPDAVLEHIEFKRV